MIGDSIVRKAIYVVIAVVGLFFLGEILSSAATVVSTFHSGNFVPLVTAAVAAVVFTRFAAMSLRGPNETLLLDIAAWGLTCYLSLTIFLIAMPYGLFASAVAFCGVLITMYLVREPPIAIAGLTEVYRYSRELVDTVYLGNSVEKWGMRAYQNLVTYLIPKKSLEDIVGFVHDNPEFNLVITHSDEVNVLIVSKQNVPSVLPLLSERNIELDRNSPLFNWGFLYKLPTANKEEGYHVSDYRVVHNATTDQFLSMQSGCALYSHQEGLSILLDPKTSCSLKSESLPVGLEARIVAGRVTLALQRSRTRGMS
jgi:hypothetical protein